jgi:uncharacterized protein (DUF1800 family)
MNSNQQKNQHLWWRAGFGPPADQLFQLPRQKPDDLFHELLKASEKKPIRFDTSDPELKEWVMSDPPMGPAKMGGLKKEEKQMIRKQSVQDISRLNIRWLQEMTETPAQLREKMSLFWHGHFATKTGNIFYDQALLNVIREHALGNFRDLLINVSKSASMIQFLNNNQNKKSHPNENFARELMELFTVGRGNYSEQDVKEAARAFTGWGTNLQGDYIFRPRLHDEGTKTFFGKTGNLTGEEVLEILLEQKQTAFFITRKIYRFFVSEQVEEERVAALAGAFYQSGYDIRALVISIFSSHWFYDPENMGTQIKSPVLWMVGIQRQLPMELKNPALQLILEHLLGQVLFSPPNVAGWSGGKHWIDSSSLMLRMQVPQIMYRSDAILSEPNEDESTMMGIRNRSVNKLLKKSGNRATQLFETEILWDSYIKNLYPLKDSDLYPFIRDFLLQTPLPMDEKRMSVFLDESGRLAKIKSITMRLMATPEYQLC